MTINIVTPKEKHLSFYAKAMEEYKKRLTAYCKLTVKQVNPATFLEKPTTHKECYISIASQGTPLSSPAFATKINQWGVSGFSTLTFFIGPFANNHGEILALSPMDMQLGLTTVVLLEQIYRSYRIINNAPYHK